MICRKNAYHFPICMNEGSSTPFLTLIGKVSVLELQRKEIFVRKVLKHFVLCFLQQV